jgi:hypothetical protein
MSPPPESVLARLPLQIGTTATWSAGRAAAALFPGLAILGVAVAVAMALGSNVSDGGRLVIALVVLGLMLVGYAIAHLVGAIRTRASDVVLVADGLIVDGGRLHGERIGWNELTVPFAELEETSARRLTMKTMLLVALSIVAERNLAGQLREPVKVWRLHVHHRGARRTIAETDRPIERDSMAAAAASVCAVVSGRRYVAQAPAVAARVVTCGRCGGPVIPDDLPTVACVYCHAPVQLPPEVRGQAAATKMLSQGRSAAAEIIAKLRNQPRAAHANAWLLVISAVMFGAWPVGWGLIAFHVLDDGFQASDVGFLLLPFAAVLAGFFFARGRLADRGALQLLTLGFGALAPQREGQPARCRRCQAPLPGAGLGGVTQCRYCAAENIVGLDLRPGVDQARAEQQTFDEALRARTREKRLWTTLTVVAAIALLGWVGGTAMYVAGMPIDTASTSPSPAPTPAPTATPTSPPRTPLPAPTPSPRPSPTKKGK